MTGSVQAAHWLTPCIFHAVVRTLRDEWLRSPPQIVEYSDSDGARRLVDVTIGDYNWRMIAIGVRELKARLSEYLRLVRAGELVLVTDRGRVVAELRSVGAQGGSVVEPGLYELVRRGHARIGGPNQADLYSALEPIMAPGAACDLLNDERSER